MGCMYSVSLSRATKPVPGRGLRWMNCRSIRPAFISYRSLTISLIGQIEANPEERDYSTGNPSSLDASCQQQSPAALFFPMRPTR